jgi:hypothetical protein
LAKAGYDPRGRQPMNYLARMENAMRKAICRAIAGIVLLAPIAKAQATSATQVREALAKTDAFFEDRTTQTLSGCSDEAWTITRQEIESQLTARNGPKISDDDVTREQSVLDACSASIGGHMDDLWTAVVSMLNAGRGTGSATFTSEIKSQLRNYEILRYAATMVTDASNKLLTDRLFGALEESHASYKALVERFNLIVAAPIYQTVPIVQRPKPLSCTAKSVDWGMNVTTTLDCN